MNMCRSSLFFAIVGLTISILPPPTIADEPSAREIADSTGCAKRLTDHAHHTGLVSNRSDPRQSAEVALCWLDAALRFDPDQPDALKWKYDLTARLGRRAEAFKALEAYVRVAPDDAIATIAWIGQAAANLQTAEERIDFYTKQLAVARPSELRSTLHVELARVHAGRGETASARKHIAAALDDWPFNPAAIRLDAEIAGTQSTPLTRVRTLVAQAMNQPRSAETMWELARLLDGLSMHDDAHTWDERALVILRRRLPNYHPPKKLLFDRAQSAYDNGDNPGAAAYCESALATDPAYHEAEMLLTKTLRRLGQQDTANARLARFRARINEALRDTASLSAFEAAQFAWFHLEIDPDFTKADRLSERAIAAAPNNPVVQRVRAVALLRNYRTKDARKLLIRRPESDQWAAAAMAEILIADGNRKDAIRILRTGERQRYSGDAYARVVRTLRNIGELTAKPPDRTPIRNASAAFDDRVLDYLKNPRDYLTLSVELNRQPIQPSDPLTCDIRLTNKGPITITLSQGDAHATDVIVDIAMEAASLPAPVSRSAYLSVSMNRRVILPPGESILVRQSLNIGVAREILASHDDRDAISTFTFTTSPVLSSTARQNVRANRLPPTIITLSRPARSPRWSEYQAVEQATNPSTSCGQAVAMMDIIGQRLSNRSVARLVALVGHDEWLVRMAAMELFAHLHKGRFTPVLRRIAETDPDKLVRRHATWLLSGTSEAQQER